MNKKKSEILGEKISEALEKDETVNLGAYMRFAKKGSGVWYKAAAVPREKWETKE
jgi:hypothetical protein